MTEYFPCFFGLFAVKIELADPASLAGKAGLCGIFTMFRMICTPGDYFCDSMTMAIVAMMLAWY